MQLMSVQIRMCVYNECIISEMSRQAGGLGLRYNLEGGRTVQIL